MRPVNQVVTASEGQPVNLTVEFCAEPAFTKLLWLSDERVYAPGSEPRSGIRALLLEVRETPTLFLRKVLGDFNMGKEKKKTRRRKGGEKKKQKKMSNFRTEERARATSQD